MALANLSIQQKEIPLASPTIPYRFSLFKTQETNRKNPERLKSQKEQ